MEFSRDYQEKLKKSLIAIKKLKLEVERLNRQQNEPIAIIGIGCRLPGDSDTPEKFWDLLQNGKSAVKEVPPERWNIDDYYDPEPGKPGKINTKNAGFMDDIDKFDNLFFGISHREALFMDPVHRLLLEVSYEAIENAGIDTSEMSNTLTSMFVGFGEPSEYGARHILSGNASNIDQYSLTGHMFTAATGRVSYLLGLNGPSVGLGTGCSSSLVSIHMACTSLRTGESDMSLAGGVSLIINPSTFVALSSMNALSEEGICRTFDASANGYGRGEGVGILLLKRYSDAVRDKDQIWGVIRGSAINQDGASNGFTAPNGAAQEVVIRAALKNAGLKPEDIDYVEAHGTGTKIGDPIELEALNNAYARHKDKNHPLYVGSVKTNFGHTEGAAGVTGVIKTILALKNKVIPPHLNFKDPNPYLDWEDMNISVPTSLIPWEKDVRRAGVSAFGVSGTNAHVILEEALPEESALNERKYQSNVGSDLLVFSAKSKQALHEYTKKYSSFLKEMMAQGNTTLSEICANAALRKNHMPYKYAISADSFDMMLEKLGAANELGIDEIENQVERKKVAFVFPGQGSQWVGMGRDMMQKDADFRKDIETFETIFAEFVDWSLTDILNGENEALFNEIDVIQPTLFAIEVAIARKWERLGIKPDGVIGHSMGEIAAACVAGILTMEDASRIICSRSILMKKLSGKGAMLATELTVKEATGWIEGKEDLISLAVSNSRQFSVLSGEVQAIHALKEELDAHDVFCRLIKVDVPSHSPFVNSITDLLMHDLEGIQPVATEIPFYSTVQEDEVTGVTLTPDYWVKNLRNPVLFYTTMKKMLDVDFDVFIEMSPHPVLVTPSEQIIEETGKTAFSIPSLRREEPELITFLQNLSGLYRIGFPLDFEKLYTPDMKRISLPLYPWDHNSFWLDEIQNNAAINHTVTEVSEHEDEDVIQKIHQLESREEQLLLLRSYLKRVFVSVTGIPASNLKNSTRFKMIGIDSMMIVQLRKAISRDIHVTIQIKEFWKHDTIELLSVHVLNDLQRIKDESPDESPDAGWLVIPKQKDNAIGRVFCFHDAGGSSSLYSKWPELIRDDVELVLIELPGRGSNSHLPVVTDFELMISELSNQIKELCDKPFWFMGHSMGGTILFEVAKRLKISFDIEPVKLFISASPSYDGFIRRVNASMSEKELSGIFPGFERSRFGDEEFFDMLLEILRADIALLDSYNYVKNSTLTCPITVILPDKDEFVVKEDMLKWENETRGDFSLIMKRGGHRYIDADEGNLTEMINVEIQLFSLENQAV
jgi:acyl transferase domain-containing protein/surfactin synthase thioesterase subunit